MDCREFSDAPKYKPPTSVIFKFHKSVPLMIFSHASLADLGRYIVRAFREHVADREQEWFGARSIIEKAMKTNTPSGTSLVTSVVREVLDWKIDWQGAFVQASVKPWILLGLMTIVDQNHNI